MSAYSVANFYAGGQVYLHPIPSEEEQRIVDWYNNFFRAPYGSIEKGDWVRKYPLLAISTLKSGLVKRDCERWQLFDHVLRLGYSSWKSSAEDNAAWTAAVNTCEQFYKLYKRNPGDKFYPLPSCPVRYANEPEEYLPSPPVSPANPPPSPAKPKAKRGRKPGSKDKQKRVPRGTLKDLTPAQKSARWRANNKPKQQQQRQQQTPPA